MEYEKREWRILIVDDEAAIRKILTEILQRNNYHCTPASDASEARNCLKNQNFDLLMCDIRMPGESGLDLVRYVKGAYPDTAVVMVTAVDDPQEAGSALDIGVYGYLIKPFAPNQVLITAANALRRRELEIKERSTRQDLERTVRERTADVVRINEELRKEKVQLRAQTKEIEEVNSALRVLLRKREEDRAVLEQAVLSNVKRVIEPYIEKLKKSGLDPHRSESLYILEANLREIVSPLVHRLSSEYLGLTPTEIQVADLIRHGKQTKEIAGLLNLSINTVVSHRYKIRRKIGLLNKKVNLQSYLMNLK
ncbi:MAG: response regulator [Pseudomonadota bacterium]